MRENKKTKPKISILGFLKLRQKLTLEARLPLFKQFLKRYKKLNNDSFELSKLSEEVCKVSKIDKKNEG